MIRRELWGCRTLHSPVPNAAPRLQPAAPAAADTRGAVGKLLEVGGWESWGKLVAFLHADFTPLAFNGERLLCAHLIIKFNFD